jgi:nucleoside-diphosphate-sugar epimerase
MFVNPFPAHPASATLPCLPDQVDDFLSTPSLGVIGCLRRHRGPFAVLGAGGKMGLHLCLMLKKALQADGREDEVIAVSRFSSLRDREEFASRGIKTLAGDLLDDAFLAALPDAPSLFFLAGIKFGTASSPAVLRQMNVDVPAKVARRFARSRIVAFSTGCVYPFVAAANGGATETTPVGPVGVYASSCVEREAVFRQAASVSGNPVALVRLNYSVEFRYGLLLDIALKIARHEPVDVSMGHCNVIWQSDAVAHAIQCLDLAAPDARPVNLTGPQILSIRGLADSLGRLLEMPVTLQGTEAGTAWLNNAAFSHARFGLPSVGIEQMLAWVAAWVLVGGETWGKPTGFERRDGNF